MKRVLLLFALFIPACERDGKPDTSEPAATSTGAIQAPSNRASGTPAVVPKPADPAQLDRMILAGYTPHSDHLHPPGVKSCPLSKGTEVVM